MVLNPHEWWLLRVVGVSRSERRSMLAALIADGHAHGEVDLAAQLAGYTMAKRATQHDLEPLFDRLMSANELRVNRVVYGDRRYRTPVILAAALHQAGVSVSSYRTGSVAGYRRLSQFSALASERGGDDTV